MRILVVATIYLPEMDGHVRLIHNHASALAKRNHEVDLVTFKRRPSLDEELIDNVHVIRVTIPKVRRRYTSQLFRLYALLKGTLRFRGYKKADIIYAPGLVPGLVGLLTRFLTHSKVVLLLADLTGMSDGKLFTHRMYRLAAIMLLKKCDLTIFPTYFARDLVIGGSGKYLNKVVVIPPGIDLELFRPEKHFNKPEDFPDQLILYAGVLRRRKGLDVLIKSFALIAQKFPKARLVFVGEGGARPALENLATKLDLARRVQFKGRVSDQELRMFHSAASIYVVPTKFDAYATSLVEAMAMGKAVVSTKGTAPSEIVENMKSGLLVKFGDVQELSSALTLLLTDRRLANTIGSEAFKRVQERYSLEKSVKSMEDEFSRLLRK